MIPLFKVKMAEDAKDIVAQTLNSGFIGEGPRVEEFERALKERFNNLLCLTLNSATSGLTLALRLCRKPYSLNCGHAPPMRTWSGINDGDEVLTTPLTCTATNWPILANNMRIKWVDVDPLTCNMDLDDLARKITPKTKAIIVVHWGGNPVDLDKLKSIQEEAGNVHGIRPVIIEDCAHAMGSTYNGVPLGSHGNLAVYSFQAIKHFTTGDGGMMIFPHADMYKRAKLLRWYGIDRETNAKDFRCEEDIPEWGYKMHMNDINASIGLANMKFIDHVTHRHNENSSFIRNRVENEHIQVSLDPFRKGVFSSEWICTLGVRDPKTHDSLMAYLKKKGIMSSRVHERNDIHSCVSEFRSILPGVSQACKTMFSVPCGWWVCDKQRHYIAETLNKWKP